MASTSNAVAIEFQRWQAEPGEIFRLRESTVDDLTAAFNRLQKSMSVPAVLDHQSDGIFDRYIILSNGKTYTVVRLGLFARCTCKDFEFHRTACKHIAYVTPPTCPECGDGVEYYGARCMRCFFRRKK